MATRYAFSLFDRVFSLRKSPIFNSSKPLKETFSNNSILIIEVYGELKSEALLKKWLQEKGISRGFTVIRRRWKGGASVKPRQGFPARIPTLSAANRQNAHKWFPMPFGWLFFSSFSVVEKMGYGTGTVRWFSSPFNSIFFSVHSIWAEKEKK